MARRQAARKYQLTINNPVEHGFTHDVLKTTIAGLPSCVYWCMCDEIGEQGTYHTHLYLAFRNAVMFQTLQPRFMGAHFEAARGSHQENQDYIRKSGKWQDDVKHETNLPDTFEESGPLPEEEDNKQKQSEAILAMVEAGASNAEIVRAYPSAMYKLTQIEQGRQALMAEEYRRKFRQLHVEYIWGKTGVGKTRGIMERYGYENVYRVTNYAHPFDGYAGEDVVLFDEFRSSLPVTDMLKYLDGYPIRLPARYGDRIACYTKAYLVSNIPIEKQYPNVQIDEPETWAAFLRRFDGNIFEQVNPDGEPSPF